MPEHGPGRVASQRNHGNYPGINLRAIDAIGPERPFTFSGERGQVGELSGPLGDRAAGPPQLPTLVPALPFLPNAAGQTGESAANPGGYADGGHGNCRGGKTRAGP